MELDFPNGIIHSSILFLSEKKGLRDQGTEEMLKFTAFSFLKIYTVNSLAFPVHVSKEGFMFIRRKYTLLDTSGFAVIVEDASL